MRLRRAAVDPAVSPLESPSMQAMERTALSDARSTPRLRGRLHQVAFFVAVPAGVVLVTVAPTARARFAGAVFALSLAALYGASAAYHLGDWSAGSRLRAKRLDHSMIFVLIAATYTPFCLLSLTGPWSWILLGLVWSGAALGIGLKALDVDGFGRTTSALYMVLGWAALLAAPAFFRQLGVDVLVLLVVGGILYTIGAVMLLSRRPNPWPRWIGYHEVWHAMTIAAGTCHFAAVLIILGAASR
jgi:hemolysin III